jgi:hypothetical protein
MIPTVMDESGDLFHLAREACSPDAFARGQIKRPFRYAGAEWTCLHIRSVPNYSNTRIACYHKLAPASVDQVNSVRCGRSHWIMAEEQIEIAFTQRPVGLGVGALSMLADAVATLGLTLFHCDSGWLAAGADAQPITQVYSDPVLVLIALDLKIEDEEHIMLPNITREHILAALRQFNQGLRDSTEWAQ